MVINLWPFMTFYYLNFYHFIEIFFKSETGRFIITKLTTTTTTTTSMGVAAYLVSKTDPAAEQNPSDDEHGEVHGRGVEHDPEHEEGPRDEHRQPPPEPPRGVGREEGGCEAGEIEGGGEELEAPVVVLAVVAVYPRLLDPPVHHREELLQEVGHRCHSSCEDEQDRFTSNAREFQDLEMRLILHFFFLLVSFLLRLESQKTRRCNSL